MPCGFWIAGADKSIYGSFVILIIKFYSPCHVANHDLYVSLGLLFCVHADYPVLQPMPCYSSWLKSVCWSFSLTVHEVWLIITRLSSGVFCSVNHDDLQSMPFGSWIALSGLCISWDFFFLFLSYSPCQPSLLKMSISREVLSCKIISVLESMSRVSSQGYCLSWSFVLCLSSILSTVQTMMLLQAS